MPFIKIDMDKLSEQQIKELEKAYVSADSSNEPLDENLLKAFQDIFDLVLSQDSNKGSASEDTKQPIEKSTTKDYPYTIYNVFHELKDSQVAHGKNSGVRIAKDDTGEFVNLNGAPLRLVSEIMNDVYSIEGQEKLTLIDPEHAIKYYNEGKTLFVDYDYTTYELSKEKKKVSLPFYAALEGAWYIKED